jgi:hypothetical protein
MATTYFVLLRSLMASLNELTHGEFEWMEFQEEAVPPKSCTSVTVTIDKIVVVMGEGCTVGTVTGLMTTTTSKSPGNTTTTTRMTVTINNVMPQEIETTGETEAGNNIGNKGDMGIEMSKVAGEAGQMAVQLSDRRRREKEKKR